MEAGASVADATPDAPRAGEISTCATSFPGSMEDEVPATVKQEANPPPVGYVAPCRLDALLIHVLRLRSADVGRSARHRERGPSGAVWSFVLPHHALEASFRSLGAL